MAGGRGAIGVTAFFERAGELFVTGRLRELAALHAFPCPVEVDGTMRVLRDWAEFEDFFGALRERMAVPGVVAMRPNVCAIEMPQGGRFRVWLRWVRRFADGEERVQDDAAVYYLERGPGGSRIHMMAFVALPSDDRPIESLGRAV